MRTRVGAPYPYREAHPLSPIEAIDERKFKPNPLLGDDNYAGALPKERRLQRINVVVDRALNQRSCCFCC